MKKRLIYLPVEMYKERWTEVVSGPDGMFESQCKKLGVEVLAIRPDTEVKQITTGVVLDTVARCKWAFVQIETLVEMVFAGAINPEEDVIYLEDFWTPGMEMIPYALSVKYPKPELRWPSVYSFCHAQSVDENDFTYPMRWWMRDFERAWANSHHDIFVAAEDLKNLLSNFANIDNVITVGTVFDSQVLLKIRDSLVKTPQPWNAKFKQVIFSSRWDEEKCPEVFMDLFEAVYQERQDIDFVVCTGSKELRSNKPALVARAKALEKLTFDNESSFNIVESASKKIYYHLLSESTIQFNSAKQDFVSYTLLEAATFVTAPLYPNYLSFPDALHHDERYLYEPGNIDDAKKKLYALLDGKRSYNFEWVYKKYENSVHRMVKEMGFDVPDVKSLAQEIEDNDVRNIRS